VSRAKKARMMRLVSPQIDVEVPPVCERHDRAEVKFTQWGSPNRIVVLELDDVDVENTIEKLTDVLVERKKRLAERVAGVRETVGRLS
jgi:hypothetical protein